MIDKIRNWNRERKRKAREKWRINLELKELDEEGFGLASWSYQDIPSRPSRAARATITDINDMAR